MSVCLSVCLSVCVSVCVSVSALQPKRLSRFWWKSTQRLSRMFASAFSLKFWKYWIDDVMAAILSKTVGALSRLYFWSDFLQICTWCSLHIGIVCYWKSARSISNFVPKWRTAYWTGGNFGAQNQNFAKCINKGSIYTEFDPLNTNLSIISHFEF